MDRTLPHQGVTAFRVRTKGVKEFRRAKILFTEEWQTVEASKLSADEQVDLLNTRTLEVEQLTGKPAASEPESKGKPAASEPESKGKAGK